MIKALRVQGLVSLRRPLSLSFSRTWTELFCFLFLETGCSRPPYTLSSSPGSRWSAADIRSTPSPQALKIGLEALGTMSSDMSYSQFSRFHCSARGSPLSGRRLRYCTPQQPRRACYHQCTAHLLFCVFVLMSLCFFCVSMYFRSYDGDSSLVYFYTSCASVIPGPMPCQSGTLPLPPGPVPSKGDATHRPSPGSPHFRRPQGCRYKAPEPSTGLKRNATPTLWSPLTLSLTHHRCSCSSLLRNPSLPNGSNKCNPNADARNAVIQRRAMWYNGTTKKIKVDKVTPRRRGPTTSSSRDAHILQCL